MVCFGCGSYHLHVPQPFLFSFVHVSKLRFLFSKRHVLQVSLWFLCERYIILGLSASRFSGPVLLRNGFNQCLLSHVATLTMPHKSGLASRRPLWTEVEPSTCCDRSFFVFHSVGTCRILCCPLDTKGTQYLFFNDTTQKSLGAQYVNFHQLENR